MKGSFFAEAGMQTLTALLCWTPGLPLTHLSPQAQLPSLVRQSGEGGGGLAARDDDPGRRTCTQTLTPLLLRRATNSVSLQLRKCSLRAGHTVVNY